MNVESFFRNADPEVSFILDKAIENKDITKKDILKLFGIKDELSFTLLGLVADELRRKKKGERVTYVINRNINFTNVCVKQCGFCAFSRDFRQEEGYILPLKEIVRRAKEAWKFGATEICIQAGLPPKMDGLFYINLCKAIKNEVPDIHIHAFSPEEILYGSTMANIPVSEYLKMLKEVGLGSLPGTSAEILVKEIRDKISPGRIRIDDWINIIKTAHKLDIPTTSTIMYGHIETHEDIATHLDIIKNIQRETGGFTEFVPLSFVFQEAPMFNLNIIPNINPGATGVEILKMHSISRIFFNNYIDNIQVSWVKEGPKMSQILLGLGANDLGGCLINESISTSAGSKFGQMMTPKELRKLIFNAGKIPIQRTSTYKIIKEYLTNEEINSESLLDKINPNIFGSYEELIKLSDFKYNKKNFIN